MKVSVADTLPVGLADALAYPLWWAAVPIGLSAVVIVLVAVLTDLALARFQRYRRARR